jgi:hypothetical protein
MPDELYDVHADAQGAKRRPLRREVERTAAVRVDHHGRDALRKQRLRRVQSLAQQAFGRVRMDVDETGRHDLATGVEFARARPSAEIADRDDAPASDGDAAGLEWPCRPVAETPIPNQEIG